MPGRCRVTFQTNAATVSECINRINHKSFYFAGDTKTKQSYAVACCCSISDFFHQQEHDICIAILANVSGALATCYFLLLTNYKYVCHTSIGIRVGSISKMLKLLLHFNEVVMLKILLTFLVQFGI